ncbi:MAG: ribose-5-phosphate isomerase RpiA [Legionellales bacterium]|nr:ribose-5-phosphate isomerase RpiA [Legionellales bacterium]
MSSDALKARVAKAALDHIEDQMIIGVGTGSTVNHLISALASIKHRIDACVASSVATEQRLRAAGLVVIDLNCAPDVPLYFDGADEVNPQRIMIKGGGGALTREKIIATVATRFICLVDESKVVDHLGHFPVAVEVLPMARSFVARELVKLGGDPMYREGFQTDNGNIILDVFNLPFSDPIAIEQEINQMVGVIENGVFARRQASLVLVAGESGIRTF